MLVSWTSHQWGIIFYLSKAGVTLLPVQILPPRHSAFVQPSRGGPVVVFEHAAEPRLAADRASV